MSRAELIYPIRQRIEKGLSLAERDPHNREILMRYYKVRTTEVKPATLAMDFMRLNTMSCMLGKKFEEANLQDIEELVFKINQKYKDPNTQNKYRSVLKGFFRWMKGYGRGEFPAEVKWIRLNKVPLVKVKAEDLIPYEECVRISEFAKYLRDKALFQCILDAGCRIGEILTVRVGEVRFNDSGAILYSVGKTGDQPCILTWSAKTLAIWMNNHPFRNDKNAPLWPSLHHDTPKQLSYGAARKAFVECVRRAGHSGRVWFHLLKHASSTEDANNGMPESFRKYKHHWTPDSRMAKVYEHMSEAIIPKIQNETWKRLTGSDKARDGETGEDQKKLELTKICTRCEYENPRDSSFCNRCGLMLDANKVAEFAVAKSKVEELLNRLTENPEKLDKLLSLIES